MAAIHDQYEESPAGRAIESALLKRIWPFVRPHRRMLAIGMLFMPLASAATVVQPWLTKHAIDGGIATGDRRVLLTCAVLFLGALLAEFGFSHLQLRTMSWVGQLTVRDLRQALFAHVLRLDMGFYTRNSVGRLLTRVTNDVESIGEMFAAGIVALMADALVLLGIVVILFAINWKLALLGLALTPLLTGFAIWIRTQLRDVYADIRVKLARINSSLNENISGMELIQSYAREDLTLAEFNERNAGHRDANYRSILLDATLFAVVELASSLTIAGLLWFGGGDLVRGSITFGTLVAFIEWMQRFFIPLRDISAKYTVLQSAMASAERIFGLFDEVSAVRQPGNPKPAPRDWSQIELDNVSFHYLAAEPVLRNICLNIRKGESIAIVGATGSGKTTLVRLLYRCYDPESGAIRMDGTDLREMDLTSLRRMFAFVQQDVFLFSGSVRRNITLDDPAITPEKIRQAVEAVHADQFINKMPNGLDSEIRERGSNLSGGERQLLAFARALAHEPQILVLDEATSSVDPVTESLIQEAIQRLLKGRTSIIIAHRLSTIRQVDRIVVMHQGKIVETGPHEELLARGGFYSRLYKLQFEHELDEAA
ncbi:MAG: putative ABC transporter ATP-binding protein [Myxococcota bacterium]|nr:putative ABC transporter ATP-binding protein [Myxococcota bacterium]